MVASPNIFSYASYTHFINEAQLRHPIRISGDTSATDYYPEDRRWNKVYEVIHALETYVSPGDVLVMLDADVAILDSHFDLDLVANMNPHSDLILAADSLDLANTGFMLIRNSKWSREFFKQWWSWREDVECDQHAFNALYEHLLNTSSTTHISVIPNHFINTQWPVQDTFTINHSVLHLVGEPAQYREAVFRHAATALCLDQPTPLLGITASDLQQARVDRSMQILQQYFDECNSITDIPEKADCFEELFNEVQYLCDITSKPTIVPIDLCSQIIPSMTTLFADAVKDNAMELILLRPLYNALVAQFRFGLMISVEDGMEIYAAVEELFDTVFERFGTSSVNVQIYNKCIGALNNALARYYSDRNDYTLAEQHAIAAENAYRHNLALLEDDTESNIYVENANGYIEAANLCAAAKQLLGDGTVATQHFKAASDMIDGLVKNQVAQKRKYIMLSIEQLLLESLLVDSIVRRESIRNNISDLINRYQLKDMPYSVTMGIEQLDRYLSTFQSNSLL